MGLAVLTCFMMIPSCFFVAELNYGFFFLFFRVPFYLWFLFIVFVVDDLFTFRCG